MGDFDLFTNLHVRNYFELKRSGHYEKALAELQIACDQGDGQGLYIMGEHVYATTFDLVTSGEFFKRSADAKCPWGMFIHGYQNCTNVKEKNKWYLKAFETGDKFIIGKCLYFGYYCVPRNHQLGVKYLLEACYENNPFTFTILLDMTNLTKEKYWLMAEYGANLGVPMCQYVMARSEPNPKKKFEWLMKGHLQKHKMSTDELAFCYYNGIGCKIDEVKGAKLLVEGDNDLNIHSRLKKGLKLNEFFIFGRALKKKKILRENLCLYKGGSDKYINNIIHVFEESIDKTQQAVFCFLLCVKGLLIKYIRQMIGKMIWKFRTDPEGWGIK